MKFWRKFLKCGPLCWTYTLEPSDKLGACMKAVRLMDNATPEPGKSKSCQKDDNTPQACVRSIRHRMLRDMGFFFGLMQFKRWTFKSLNLQLKWPLSVVATFYTQRVRGEVNSLFQWMYVKQWGFKHCETTMSFIK